jgi:hypothetical protein
VKYQQFAFIGGKEFVECRVAGGGEGPSGRSADTMRNLSHALNLGWRVDTNLRISDW